MKSVFLSLILLPIFLQATDLSPWTGVDLELHPRITNQWQKYPSQTNDLLGVGIEGSYDVWQADIEANMAWTHKLRAGFNDLRLTGRYQWMNDIIGDPVTVSTGITLIRATHHSLRDPYLFHHGVTEGEIHVAVGKEWSTLQFWTTRLWGIGAFGASNQGSPWLRADFGLGKNWSDVHTVRLFINTLVGLGDRRLHKHDFHGYGAIAHRSVDVGINYSYRSKCNDVITLCYAYRPFARNFPQHANIFTLQWMVPFSIL